MHCSTRYILYALRTNPTLKFQDREIFCNSFAIFLAFKMLVHPKLTKVRKFDARQTISTQMSTWWGEGYVFVKMQTDGNNDLIWGSFVKIFLAPPVMSPQLTPPPLPEITDPYVQQKKSFVRPVKLKSPTSSFIGRCVPRRAGEHPIDISGNVI